MRISDIKPQFVNLITLLKDMVKIQLIEKACFNRKTKLEDSQNSSFQVLAIFVRSSILTILS